MARANIEFRGRVPDEELRELYARCRAYIMPGEEDFGITAVEALASGKAVIALGHGGVLESAEDRSGAFFYDQPEEDQLEQAIARFEKAESHIAPLDLQASVTRFSEAEFLSKMSRVLSQPQPTSRPCPSAPPVSCASES
jgi:glycosyltransferase involved in cell wall biosynthesis